MEAQQESRFRFEPLDKRKHDRAAFSCEQEALDVYIKKQASQDIERRIAAVIVLTPDGRTIAGYYTLSQYAVELGNLPPEVVKNLKLQKYPEVPATLLGRLARSAKFKGLGLGEILLMGALRHALDHSKSIASMAVVVDAKDEYAKAFYKEDGFIELPDHPNRVFIPMATVEQMFPPE